MPGIGASAMAGSPATPGSPAMPVPAVTGRGGRRKWPFAVAALVAWVAVVAGLLAWAPWVTPPVLRPAGLAAGQATTSSVSFHWSPPATGPLPDQYLVFYNGRIVARLAGTVTSWQATGLAPASDFAYRVQAVRGGMPSPVSAVLLLNTATPPVSDAQLTGPWNVDGKIVEGASSLSGNHGTAWSEYWTTTPQCTNGPCAVRLTGMLNGHSFKVTLARAGAVYTGTTNANVIPCGTGPGSFADPSTLRFRITVTSGGVSGQNWIANGWSGSLVMSSPYVTSGNYFCNPTTLKLTLAGNPGSANQ
jgi:Fibronectin type III domain